MRLTTKEKHAISELEKLAKRWPKKLVLFSWKGTLHVLKPNKSRTMGQAIVATFGGIPSDGGDPNMGDPSS
jgi:hypothetical protein